MEYRKVFIVDDSQIIRDRLIARLKDIPGIKSIGSASNVTTAFIALSNETPDVAIVDLQLPDGCGIDILASIKKNHAGTIVIMLTNYPYALIKSRCIELGADYFFDKSNEFENVFKIFSTSD